MIRIRSQLSLGRSVDWSGSVENDEIFGRFGRQTTIKCSDEEEDCFIKAATETPSSDTKVKHERDKISRGDIRLSRVETNQAIMNKSINGQRSAQNQNSCPKNGLYIYRVESIFRAQILVLCRTMYVMRRTVTVLRITEIVLHRMDSILHRQRFCCAKKSPFCAERSLKLVPEK